MCKQNKNKQKIFTALNIFVIDRKTIQSGKTDKNDKIEVWLYRRRHFN
jgi:hypothetical protein